MNGSPRMRGTSRGGSAPRAGWMAALALPVALWGCGPDAPVHVFDEARQAAITDSVRATLEGFEAAIESGDWDRLAQFYADDPRFRWMEDGRVTYESREAIIASLLEVGGSFTHGTLAYSDLEILPLAPGLAAISTRFDQRLVGGDGGGFNFSGVIGATLIHGSDGWKFLFGHTSTAR